MLTRVRMFLHGRPPRRERFSIFDYRIFQI